MQKRKINVYQLIFCIMIVLSMGAFLVGLYAYFTESFGSFWEYSCFEISDWLINYQGGFVRRGLVGHIFFLLYQIQPFPVRDLIVLLYIMGFGAILVLLISVMKDDGLSLFILPFSICLYYAFACDLLWTRRDYWSLILTYAIFYNYFVFINKNKVKNLLFFYFFSLITLLMHEASFFYTFPVLMIHNLSVKIRDGFLKKKYILKFVITWLPIICIFIVVITNKGNRETMIAVWDSWEPCFRRYPTGSGNIPIIGDGVDFLNKNSFDAVLLHIRLVWLARFAPYVPSFPFNVYIIFCVYYLLTNINVVDLGFYKLKPVNKVLMSNVLIVQFLALFPMFGFLSCDMGRVVPYWTISSILLYHMLINYNSFNWKPDFVDNFSVSVQRKLDANVLFSKRWFYLIIITTLPLKYYYGASYDGIIPFQFIIKAYRFFIL